MAFYWLVVRRGGSLKNFCFRHQRYTEVLGLIWISLPQQVQHLLIFFQVTLLPFVTFKCLSIQNIMMNLMDDGR